MTEPDRTFLDEFRKFAADEADSLARLEELLDRLRAAERARNKTLDTTAIWQRVEERLGWSSSTQPQSTPDDDQSDADGR